jgi:hypothetical protein
MSIRSDFLLLMLAVVAPLWSQDNPSTAPLPAEETVATDDKMATPPTVSIEGYPMSFTADESRRNFLRGGLQFSSAYDDNVFPSGGRPVSDVSYSVWPSISLDQSRPRLTWTASYLGGFTFYQKTTVLNQADHNASVILRYRLSPHVTLELNDNFVKTSNFFSSFTENPSGSTSGGLQNPNFAVIAPISDQYRNSGSAQISYQFGANAMIGASGNFYDLRYTNRSQSAGLFDSSTRAGEGFYAHRLSKMHYIGATYRFEDIQSQPSAIETQNHTALLFYTLYLSHTTSVSAFGGPERSETQGGGIIPFHTLLAEYGGSLGWQGLHTSFSASFSRRVTDGGGLIAPARAQIADASFRRRLSPTLDVGVSGDYSRNDALNAVLLPSVAGHSVSGSAFVQWKFGRHLRFNVDYSRLHQSYGSIAALAVAPDRNRVSAGLYYGFERPLGR